MWLNSLKVAIIEKDTDKLSELLETLPEFENTQQMEEGLYLLKQAAELMYTLRDETAVSMRQLKKNIDFLSSTGNQEKSKFDIKS